MSMGPQRSRQRGKNAEEKVAFAVGHRIRVAILTLLNEGTYTADDLAEFIGESRQTIHHHLSELREAGSIEIARSVKKRNADHHYYRAVEPARYSEQALSEMEPEERKEIAGLIVQLATAEAMQALDAGRLSDDPRVCLMWNWFNLDSEGREALFDEQERHWERVEEIEAESANRRSKTGEPATSYIVSQWGFQRARSAPLPADVD